LHHINQTGWGAKSECIFLFVSQTSHLFNGAILIIKISTGNLVRVQSTGKII